MKYPNRKTTYKKTRSYSNLGMTLEKDLDSTNSYYLNNNIAVIHKKPTPVQVVDVSYPARNKAKIVEAYYKTPSTTDYNGIYKGRYIDFDAKETNSKTSFPLKNIHPHQIDHLKGVVDHGGIAFLIIHWKNHDKYFLLPSDIIFKYWDNKEEGRKSIPYDTFLKDAHEVILKFRPRIDYLPILDKLYF